jgi:hypothetical protein
MIMITDDVVRKRPPKRGDNDAVNHMEETRTLRKINDISIEL